MHSAGVVSLIAGIAALVFGTLVFMRGRRLNKDLAEHERLEAEARARGEKPVYYFVDTGVTEVLIGLLMVGCGFTLIVLAFFIK